MSVVEKLAGPLKKLGPGDWRIKLVVALGLLGMALVAVSQFLPEKRPPPDSATAVFTSSSDYAAALEERLTGLIAEMDGAGRVRVMVTLENAGETVYAQEQTRNVDKQEETPAEQASAVTTSQKENIEQRYILVEGRNGGREALVRAQMEPRVQGVVVLCEGAGNLMVEQSITHVVTTALNVPTTRVAVVKITK
jgi:stage III sporulation protein AG